MKEITRQQLKQTQAFCGWGCAVLERLMREFKRRSRGSQLLPQRQSVIRLPGAVQLKLMRNGVANTAPALNPEALRAMEMPS